MVHPSLLLGAPLHRVRLVSLHAGLFQVGIAAAASPDVCLFSFSRKSFDFSIAPGAKVEARKRPFFHTYPPANDKFF